MVELNKDFLHSVMKVQSTSGNQTAMQFFILDEVERLIQEEGILIDTEIDDSDNLYFSRGDGKNGYPCLVSHMDTVHDIVPDNQFQIIRFGDTWHGFNPVKYEMTGIGGDDKVGVYLCLEALRQFDNIKVAFFVDEEVGCVGSSQANMSWFDDCNLVLQADRRGNDDFVQFIGGVDLFDKEFSNAVSPILNKHGYGICKWGGITDVGQLKENGLKVACANMSAGYHNPHRDNEYIVLKEVDNVLNLAFSIVEELGDKRWEHEADLTPYNYNYGYGNYTPYQGTQYDFHTDYTKFWQDDYDNIPPKSKSSKKKEETEAPKSSKTWSEDSYYMNDRFTDYSATLDDTLDLEPAPSPNECMFCGSSAVELDSSEDDWWCHSCNDYCVITLDNDDVEMGDLSYMLEEDRNLLMLEMDIAKDKEEKKKVNRITVNKKIKGRERIKVYA